MVIAAAATIATARPATADGYRAVIDRVDLEPASIGGARLRVYLTALSLEGASFDLSDPKAIKLSVGSSELRAPYALGRFDATATDTAIVFLIQATTDFSEVLPVVSGALDDTLLAKLGDRTQVAILTYGETVGTARLAPVKAARGKATQLAVEGGTDPALTEAIERALPLLKRAKTEPEGRPLRKMIVIIGDGRDSAKDTSRITQLGRRAAREGVRIHALGFVPSDKRRSLLTLGELSKKSLGTFRWNRSAKESWAPSFDSLQKEINEQLVVTYFVPSGADIAGKQIRIATSGTANVESNQIKVPALSCNGEPCETGYCAGDRCTVPRGPSGRGFFGWILVVLGIAIGLAVVLGLIGYAMSRRQQRGAGAAEPPGAGAPGAGPPPPRPAKKGSKPPKNLPSAPPVVAAPPAAPPTSGARLYILSGPRAGETLGVRHGFSIGAAPNNDLVIADGYASTLHAQIAIDTAGNCWVYDRGSTNGTFVNGVRVTERALDHGTTVRIGSTELRFLVQ
jgi:hypothetical protein